MSKATLAFYIAHQAPEEANELLMNNRYRPARNTAELEFLLNEFLADGGTDALSQLMEIHPDRDEIMKGGTPKKQRHSNCSGGCSNFSGDNDGYSNCSGCSGKCGQRNSNASGGDNSSGPTAHSMINGNMTMAITVIAIFGMIGLFMIKAK